MGTIIEKHRSAWNYGHLLWLGVDPDYARKHIGSMLFERFHEIMEAEGIRMLMVDTQADNKPAIKFFKRKGFANPTKHVYMTLNLNKDG
jgi:ribosomal protein S18 acetylase RimI-like enzyme